MKIGLLLAAGLVFMAATRSVADSLPMDTPVSVEGIQTASTGVGSAQVDPRWQSYPARILEPTVEPQGVTAEDAGLLRRPLWR